MDCPNCDKEMKNKSYLYYGLGDWDMDHPSTLHEEYFCKDCKIKYAQGEWSIPKIFERPTEKQIKCVMVINQVLELKFNPLIKSRTRVFINKYMQKSKEISKYKYDGVQPDNINYENDAWCEYY